MRKTNSHETANMDGSAMDKQILNKTDAAEFLGVNRRTILNWQKAGFGPVFTALPGGREITTLKCCEKFLEDLAQTYNTTSNNYGART
jgi:hypothetical protein